MIPVQSVITRAAMLFHLPTTAVTDGSRSAMVFRLFSCKIISFSRRARLSSSYSNRSIFRASSFSVYCSGVQQTALIRTHSLKRAKTRSQRCTSYDDSISIPVRHICGLSDCSLTISLADATSSVNRLMLASDCASSELLISAASAVI